MLKIYNTIAQEKQEFKAINNNQINIYVCGVTVYDYCHIGHARTYLVFDSIVRYLKLLGYKVNYVRNITDVDDKILNKAKQTGEDFNNIAKKYTKAMHDDFKALNLLLPDYEPKVTDFIDNIINFIKILLNNNYAYIGKNGDIFYSIDKFNNYGLLSKRNLDNMQSGDRVEQEIQRAKLNLHDFVLWKLVDLNDIGWQSEWGYGRPGWHIECSAMALQLLGKNFDIHGGGFDLIFPHHENEIAQSEAINDCKFVNYWMHVGFLNINQEKMSKSLNNFTLIRDILKTTNPEVLRYWMLSSHYRSQIDFVEDKLDIAKLALDRLYLALRDLDLNDNYEPENIYTNKFITAMNDDFNTPDALAVLFELAKEININKKDHKLKQANKLGIILKNLAQAIGLLLFDPQEFLQGVISVQSQEIEDLIQQRNLARKQKKWQQADLIRDKLLVEYRVYLEDQGDKTVWRKK